MTLCRECKKQASFNYKGLTGLLYCRDHKKDGMISVRHPICLKCEKRARYNKIGEEPLYCYSHSDDDMIDVDSTKCKFKGCTKYPSFNYPTEKTARFCYEHSVEGMVGLKHNKCIEPNCPTSAVFNYIEESTPLYCKAHIKDGMDDVVSKRCYFDKCPKRILYRFKDLTKPKYCNEHKQEGMHHLRTNLCIVDICEKTARYNYEGQKKELYCEEHKLDSMINITAYYCLTPHCNTQVKKGKYEGYCLFCYVQNNPDKPVARNFKTKEKHVSDYLKTQFPELTWFGDKAIKDGCSKRRPDLLVDFGNQIIIIEVDENKHSQYDCSCEHKRLMEISKDLNHRPLIMIRFNPDSYTRENGTKIKSPWKVNAYGTISIPFRKKTDWQKRLESLKETFKYWTTNTTSKTVEVIELYY